MQNQKPNSVEAGVRRGLSLRNPMVGSLTALAVCGISACGVLPIDVGGGLPGGGGVAEPPTVIPPVPADGPSAQLRSFVDDQVGIENLIVPAEEDIPSPLLEDGTRDPRFITTEAKRYLGKQLFNDPVRTNNIRPEFGGVPETAQTASCGSCHLGEFTGKGGQVQTGSLGFDGLGFTDADGNFTARRFQTPGLVDLAPTLTQVLDDDGNIIINGQADAVDSVQRLVPSMIGFAFNNRLLSFGIAGEPGAAENPDNLPAGESLAQITQTVHRMFGSQGPDLQAIPAYVSLFKDAYPEEAAEAEAAGDLNLLVNDDTILRAVASFLRTVAARNSPWDKFLEGDDNALTEQQVRGAKLFFTEATNGGAGCFSCHSGPQLNKQVGDEQGVGVLVDENFFNIGLNDHPLQALAQEAFGDPEFRDLGRFEVTRDEDDVFEFRTPHLRNLVEHGNFMHSGSFFSVREVVEYFNNGVAENEETGAASTFSPRFSNPRGGSEVGLGLNEGQVDDLVAFLEYGLLDPTFSNFDPNSSTRVFRLTEDDLNYSEVRPELAALGAIDGLMVSGLAPTNNDALSRRDLGLEFLDVTDAVDVSVTSQRRGNAQRDVVRIENNSSSVVDTHLLLVAKGLNDGVTLRNSDEVTGDGDPFLRVFLDAGVLLPGQSIETTLRFDLGDADGAYFDLVLLSGQGTP